MDLNDRDKLYLKRENFEQSFAISASAHIYIVQTKDAMHSISR